MTPIEQIKAEIERLKELHRTPTFPGDIYEEGGINGYQLALDKISSFIESLEKEPKPEICSRCAYYQYDSCNYPGGGRNTLHNENGICECNMFEPLDEPKGYDEAYLNEKIAKAKKSWEGVDVDKFMDEVRGREPQGLDEAAVAYANSIAQDSLKKVYCMDDFRAGAEWMAGQAEKRKKTYYTEMPMDIQ